MNLISYGRILFIFAFISKISFSFSQWVNTQGVYKATNIQTFGTDGINVYAGSEAGGVFVTKDNGSSWYTVNSGLPPNNQIREFAFIGTNQIYACVALSTGGIYKSLDEGDSWKSVNYGLADQSYCIASKGTDLYTGTSDGVYKSINGGASWFKASTGIPDSKSIYEIEVASNGIIYAGSYLTGIYKSTNDGLTWTQINTGLTSLAIYALTTLNNEVYAAFNNGIFKCVDGNTWTELNSAPSTIFFELQGKNDTIYAATDNGLFISGDGGSSWVSKPIGGETNTVSSVIATNSYIIASTYYGNLKGLVKSTAGGNSWTEINNGLLNASSYALLQKDSYLFAGVNPFGILRSEDGGATWTSVNFGLNVSPTSGYYVSDLITNGTDIFVTTSEMGVFKSSDNGNSWTRFGNDISTSISMGTLAIHGTSIYAGSYWEGLYKSSISSAGWSKVTTGNFGNTINSIVSYGGNIYIGTESGLYVSSDEINWTALTPPYTGVRAITFSGNRIIISLISGVWISDNNGATWTTVYYAEGKSFLKSGSDILMGTYNKGVLISKDNGTTWQQYNTGIWSRWVPELATDGIYIYSTPRESSIYKRPVSDQSKPLLPSQFILSGTANFCANTSVPLKLNDSEQGVNYQVLRNGSAFGSPVSGTGNALTLGSFSNEGTYSVVAKRGTTTELMFGTAILSLLPLPTSFNIIGSGSYCQGEKQGLPVSLTGSETGVYYQLKKGSTNIGSLIAGTGNTISFGTQIPGVYSVVATNNIPMCSTNMNGPATIIENPLPVRFTLTGNGSYCSDKNGKLISLSNSQVGVRYSLLKNNNPYGSYFAGTGTIMSMGLQSAGSYKVIAIVTSSQCKDTMNGEAKIDELISPTAFNVSGSGTYCQGDSGIKIQLDESSIGVKYKLLNQYGTTMNTISGTGSSLSFGNHLKGTYTIVGVDTVTACEINMNGNSVITENICTAISNRDDDNLELSYYPNPSNGKFTINGLDNFQEIILINSMGQKEYFYTNQINSNFKGMVVLIIQTDKGTFLKKIEIQ